MAYLFTPPNLTSGIDTAVISTATSVPAFAIGTLIFAFMVVLIGGSSSQYKRNGYADIPLWSLFASLSCLMLSLIMTIKEGLITLEVLGIVLAITIITGFWYFMSSARNELT